ncbi:hypothetical protein BRARA_B02761 [Brassica rapa]|uniref:Replication factor A C-terminal domain-containing protein n=1 Tax=Brassica campestris TaxID=3711 RepID=A0A398AD43_BRACM|nr:hypothetical protein BRARA_B02761 [Brassica rapa]
MWKIKMKVIRLWKQYSAGGVTHSCGSYRSTTHAYMISFLSTTRVRSCEQLPEDLSGFEPVKYKYVLDGTLNPDYLVDIIGQIVEISHIDHINVNGKETEKISLDDERLPMVLWGKFACDVCEAMRVQDEHSTVLVLRFGKIKVWKEDRSLSNAYNVSNPPIIEVRKFIASLPKDDLPLAIVESKNSAIVNGVSAKDDFFILTPRKTIAQILETKQKCILLCTITAIDSDMGWFYLSCKVCSKRVLSVPTSPNDDGNDEDDLNHTYYCVKCKTYNPMTLPRYTLHLVVLDNTSNTKLVLFDNHAMQLLNQPCLQIAGLLIKSEIQIERENFVYKQETYKALKESEDGQFHDLETQSDAPEVSLAIQGLPSKQSESFDMTPAKRIRAVNIHTEEILDDNTVTRSVSSVKIKKEKFAKSG